MIIDDIDMGNFDEDGEILANGSVSESEEDDSHQPPATSVIVTNLALQIFDDPDERALFEELFQELDETVTFQYFKSFRRMRVNFTTAAQAAAARLKVHMMVYKNEVVKCYFTQPIVIGSGTHLQPPKRDKQFLISPPASPPVGWEPIEEAQPLVNYDLIAAVANLAPGESHELHPPMEDKPGIIVHVCEEPGDQAEGPRPRIQQTRRPYFSA